MPRIVTASVLGYLAGQLLSWVLVKIKERWGEEHLWAPVGATLVGILDTLIFCTVAFYGVITGAEFLNYLVVG